MSERNPSFLHEKFRDLNLSKEVEATVKRKAKQTGEKEIPAQKPEERVQTYLDYLKESLDLKNPKREEKFRRFKDVLHDKYVTKSKDIPESYWESIRRRHREEGHGDIEIPEDQKAELSRDIEVEQTQSLDLWIDYLASPDAEYPDWFKYYALRSVLKLNRYDKQKKRFTERTKGTVQPYPDLNREALGFVCDALIKKQAGSELQFGYDIQPEDQQQFKQYVNQENFAKMYAWAMEHFNPIPEELLKKTQGEWRNYPKGSDPKKLVKDISAYSTGWCIRGEATATRYLSHSDLEVYFSQDKDNNSTIPRLVVVRRDDQTEEVRGVAHQENIDPYIGTVVDKKLDELPDGKLFRKKSIDMKQMTEIEKEFDKKTKQWKRELTRDELLFLYEIDSKIQGFGYDDPRPKELRQTRQEAGLIEQDQCNIFNCKPEQIVRSQEDFVKNTQAGIETKAYVGPLFKDIFKTFADLEYIYTSFPESRIRKTTIEIGGKTEQQLEQELQTQHINVSDYAKFMLRSKNFKTSDKVERIDLIRLKVEDLNLSNPITENIYKKVQDLGLELCPVEVGPNFRLQYKNQPMDEWLYIGMKQITNPVGDPGVFGLGRDGSGLWLNGNWADPSDRWGPDNEFVFRVRE